MLRNGTRAEREQGAGKNVTDFPGLMGLIPYRHAKVTRRGENKGKRSLARARAP